jgi:hypothetical protein
LVLLSYHTSSAKDIELLVLRHEVAKIGQSEHFTHRAAGPLRCFTAVNARTAVHYGGATPLSLPAALFSTTDLLMEPSRESGAEVDQTGVGTR